MELFIICYWDGQIRTTVKLIGGFIVPEAEMIAKLMI
jgi:hypothetical protein